MANKRPGIHAPHPKTAVAKRIARHAATVLSATLAQASGSPQVPLDAGRAAIVCTAPEKQDLIHLREYQRPVLEDKTRRVVLLEWSRQVGKSHTLANWAADRALAQLAAMLRGDINRTDWLIVVISNSKANGAEFGVKCAAVADIIRKADDELTSHGYDDSTPIVDDELQGLKVTDCAHRIEIKSGACRVRILILAASPRTARGFSGDLILDEFAFHENAKEIWNAAEPIIRSNPEYLCRIASTHNGPNTLFNKWCRTKFYPVVSVPLSLAWKLSRHDPRAPLILTSMRRTGADGRPVEITPDEAREEADDQKAYDQNYELKPYAEAGALLNWELIGRARRAPQCPVCKDGWTFEALQHMASLPGKLWVGMDVGRSRDLSTIIVARELGSVLQITGILRMTGNLIIQAREMERLIDSLRARMQRVVIDRSGIGQGVVDHLVLKYGADLIMGVHFSERVPVDSVGYVENAAKEKVVTEPVTEHMARALLKKFLDDLIEIPADTQLEESLHKPERIVTEAGKVFIAAERTKNEDGSVDHADHFWALALLIMGQQRGAAGAFTAATVAASLLGGAPMAAGSWDGNSSGDSREGGEMSGFWGCVVSRRFKRLTPPVRCLDPFLPVRRRVPPSTFVNKPIFALRRTLRSAAARLARFLTGPTLNPLRAAA